MPVPCKACVSPSRGYIDGMLRDGTPFSVILAELLSRGETFNRSNLDRHRPHVARLDEARMDEGIEESIEELRSQSVSAPPMLRPAYATLIRFMESMSNRGTPSVREALAAAESIHRITGMGSKHTFLLAFAERAFQPGNALGPPVPDGTTDES